ncbi:MAG TPA: hypothetical protein DEA78_09130 [Cyanobacteria bacterium UBA11159]|nr:hypothetical protein [Cyanobacteria bacterium UBA11367]HBE56679.1 hypothetical protein [Cyanobacteria bacterium UBA11366]HBK65108.1 hypothetical protein [Cyanobacteria bacterium UBA11166]HBR73859.1 hypothetical protein [Cyanobacteria bacterium UBA11159]HBS67686.1 hypothetical protein [Cyanobacteria bacterium UBA11153]HCA97980.1 hypothetical protein [Cyanobacteria bacterium UBA9226]
MATIIVTTTANSGTGSLRAAIASAQAGDTIKFDSTLAQKTITLTSGQLAINKNLIIDGVNTPGLKISGNNAYRIFDVTTASNVTIRNLTITNGKTTGVGENGAGAGIRTASGSTLQVVNTTFQNNYANGSGGGAIFGGFRSKTTVTNSKFNSNSTGANNETGKSQRGGGAIAIKSESSLTVTNSIFTNNKGVNGGAINTLLSGLTIKKSTFKQNTSTNSGGAIFVDGASAKIDDSIGGNVEISESRFDGNKGVSEGGGLFIYLYPLDRATVSNSTIINNRVSVNAQGNAVGGGLRHGNGELILTNTTFANNIAERQGGGLWVGNSAPVTINNSTFYGNRAESIDGKEGLGGGIALSNGSAATNITKTTIAKNYAGFMGGGLFAKTTSAKLTNTLVTDNFANNGGNPWNINHQTTTTFTNGGGNVQSLNPNPNDTKITAGVQLVNPQLGSFTDNGSYLQTPPLPGNPDVTAGAMAVNSVVTNLVPINQSQPRDLTVLVADTNREVITQKNRYQELPLTDATQLGETDLPEVQSPELINLADKIIGSIPTQVIVNSDAAYDSRFSFYPPHDLTDKIGNLKGVSQFDKNPSYILTPPLLNNDWGDGNLANFQVSLAKWDALNLNFGDSSYAKLAASERAGLSSGLSDGVLSAPFIIPAAAAEDFLGIGNNKSL